MQENLNMQAAEPTKKSKKKLIIICVAVSIVLIGVTIFLFIFLNSNKNKIVGTWKEDNSYIQFTANGEINDPLRKTKIGIYSVDGDTLKYTVQSTYEERTTERTINFRIVKLTSETLELENLSSGNSRIAVYTKKEPTDEEIEQYAYSLEFNVAYSISERAYMDIYTTIQDKKWNGADVSKSYTDGVVSVESLLHSDDANLRSVYYRIKEYPSSELGDNLGYIYVYYDPNNLNDSFVQWSKSEKDGVVGQYPNTSTSTFKDRITFGEKHS